MNWLVYLTGSAEIGSAADNDEKRKPSSLRSEDCEEEEFEGGYVPLDETMGDPFAD